MASVTLPTAGRGTESYTTGPAGSFPLEAGGAFDRIAYAAAHVVADPIAASDPWGPKAAVDWDATLRFRHHLWKLGFRIAEAMDTSQRGMGLDWPTAAELIRRSLREARTVPGADLASGCGTDQLAPGPEVTLAQVRAAYEQQLEVIESEGGRAILMASRALVRAAKGPDDYLRLYGDLIRQAKDKVVLHWLGPMFDPALQGYWGTADLDRATDTVLELVRAHAPRIEGIKISLLDKDREIDLRRRLPPGVLMFTGDDFNYAELIEGDGQHLSHALLGIFDPIAPAASAALTALAKGDLGTYRRALEPTVPLSRKIFEAPTQYYKAGVVLLAWLNGHQDHFTMVGGMQSARGALHYADIFRLADKAGLLADPDLAGRRMKSLMALHGVG
ncbi:MAG: dihydrodipicolinate synthase family protein [Geminicoccaceae bacterium]